MSDKLDTSTNSFDPVFSIYSSDEVPDPSAPIFNNVEDFVNKYSQPKATTSTSKKTIKSSNAACERRFTEEQMPIKCPKKKAKNILTFMENQTEGAMARLQKCVENNSRIKVTIRKLNGIRGTCTGILLAFDKHWNLALIDVDETFNRMRYPRPEIDNQIKKNSVERVGESTIRVLKIRRNSELCQRHIPQVVLRGEHIAFVQILV